MLSTKPVLPKFLKILVIVSMAFGSVTVFAGQQQGGEEIGDLKDMKIKRSIKADELTNQLDADGAASSLTKERNDVIKKTEEMADQVEEIKPGE